MYSKYKTESKEDREERAMAHCFHCISFGREVGLAAIYEQALSKKEGAGCPLSDWRAIRVAHTALAHPNFRVTEETLMEFEKLFRSLACSEMTIKKDKEVLHEAESLFMIMMEKLASDYGHEANYWVVRLLVAPWLIRVSEQGYSQGKAQVARKLVQLSCAALEGIQAVAFERAEAHKAVLELLLSKQFSGTKSEVMMLLDSCVAGASTSLDHTHLQPAQQLCLEALQQEDCNDLHYWSAEVVSSLTAIAKDKLQRKRIGAHRSAHCLIRGELTRSLEAVMERVPSEDKGAVQRAISSVESLSKSFEKGLAKRIAKKARAAEASLKSANLPLHPAPVPSSQPEAAPQATAAEAGPLPEQLMHSIDAECQPPLSISNIKFDAYMSFMQDRKPAAGFSLFISLAAKTMKCQEFRADERVVIKVAQLATAIGHSSLKCTDLIGQLVVLRDNLLESLLSKNKEQAQDWIMRLLVLPWLEAAAQHAALSTIDSEIVRYYWGGEDLLSFALRAMNAAQMLLPGHPLSEQSWHSYALVSELLMGTAFTVTKLPALKLFQGCMGLLASVLSHTGIGRAQAVCLAAMKQADYSRRRIGADILTGLVMVVESNFVRKEDGAEKPADGMTKQPELWSTLKAVAATDPASVAQKAAQRALTALRSLAKLQKARTSTSIPPLDSSTDNGKERVDLAGYPASPSAHQALPDVPNGSVERPVTPQTKPPAAKQCSPELPAFRTLGALLAKKGINDSDIFSVSLNPLYNAYTFSPEGWKKKRVVASKDGAATGAGNADSVAYSTSAPKSQFCKAIGGEDADPVDYLTSVSESQIYAATGLEGADVVDYSTSAPKGHSCFAPAKERHSTKTAPSGGHIFRCDFLVQPRRPCLAATADSKRHKDMQDLARELLDLKEERRQLMGSVTWPPDPTSHQRAGQQAIEIEKKQAELGVQLAQLVASGGSLPTAEAAMATAGACIIQGARRDKDAVQPADAMQSRSDKASFGRSAGRGAVIKETVTAAAWPTVRASPTARSKHIRHLHFNPLYGDGAAGNAQGTPPEGSISDKRGVEG